MTPVNPARARGVLLGQFVGDALGTSLEFASREECLTQYPKGLRDIVGGGPFRMEAGQVTDDGELAVTLARSLVDHGLDLDARARGYIGWLNTNPPDRGVATSSAFGGWDHTVTGVALLERTAKVNGDPNKQANGALMRVSPLAIYGATFPSSRLAELAREDARLSHPSAVCQWSNVAFVRAIQVALCGGNAQQGVLAAAEIVSGQCAPVEKALLEISAAPKADGGGQGWVLVALRMAFHALQSGRTFEDALVDCVMAGGDTDTNGAITGALLGAFHGEAAIPARWTRTVLERAPRNRPKAYHVQDALQLVDALLARGAREAAQ